MERIRNEYPRPQFRRDEWIALNGEWEFTFDDENTGVKNGYTTGRKAFDSRINVPFTYQYEASGIHDETVHKTLWYRRTVNITREQRKKSALLCFNGANYETDVWVNGQHAAYHKGAFAPFNADVTALLKEGENTIVVRCIDDNDQTMPRGKQSWTGERFACWYIANSGIWQSVWLEFFGKDCIADYSIVPDIETLSFSGNIETLRAIADTLEIKVTFEGKVWKTETISLNGKYTRYSVSLMERNFVDEDLYWYPNAPRLFYVDLALKKDGETVDTAHTRFGMRKISIDEGGQICLNHRPLYQRLILDQGYWRESGITPPSVESLKEDILLAKEMGFNGARKHQKFEDPYWYYLADEIGYLTWCEMPSAYNFNAKEVLEQSREWQEIINVAKNFASVITYVPLNESWGVRKVVYDKQQQDYARALYYITKAADPTRPVSTNDGWENVSPTDLITIHDYASDSSKFDEKYTAEKYDMIYPQGRRLMAEGNYYEGQPVIFSEFGGVAMQKSTAGANWGYGKGAECDDEFYARIENLVDGIYRCDFQGYCYTQLTDVQQEVNGLLDEDHKPKFDNARLRRIFAR